MRFNRSKFRRELRKLTREIEKEAKKEIKKVKVEIPVEYAITKPEGGGGMTLKVKATKVLQALHDRVNGRTCLYNGGWNRVFGGAKG